MILPLLAIPLLFAFSPDSHAAVGIVTCGYDETPDDCLANTAKNKGHGYYIHTTLDNGKGLVNNLYAFFRDEESRIEYMSQDGHEVVLGIPFTDEECSSQYSGSYSVKFPIDSVDTSYVSAGACALYSVPDPETGVDVGVCTFNDDGVTQSCFGDWDAISTGKENTIDFDSASSAEELLSDSDLIEQSEEVPDYLSETSDPSSCPSGSMSAGGISYCVDTSSVTVTDLGGSAWTGGGSGGGTGDGDGDGDGSGDGDGETDGQCDPETDGECEGESTECLPGMSCYVPTDAQVEAKFFDYFPGSVDNTQVTEYDASDFELDGEYESGLTSGSCPAPVPVTLALGGNSHTFEITFEFFCQFALLIRGLVLASCSFLAANIIYRGVVTLV